MFLKTKGYKSLKNSRKQRWQNDNNNLLIFVLFLFPRSKSEERCGSFRELQGRFFFSDLLQNKNRNTRKKVLTPDKKAEREHLNY